MVILSPFRPLDINVWRVQHSGIESLGTAGHFLGSQQSLELLNKVVDNERLSLYLVVLVWCEAVYAYAQQSRQLSEVLFCNDNLRVAHEHVSDVSWQWIDVLHLCQCHLMTT